jgi:hypothetical protein
MVPLPKDMKLKVLSEPSHTRWFQESPCHPSRGATASRFSSFAGGHDHPGHSHGQRSSTSTATAMSKQLQDRIRPCASAQPVGRVTWEGTLAVTPTRLSKPVSRRRGTGLTRHVPCKEMYRLEITHTCARHRHQRRVASPQAM